MATQSVLTFADGKLEIPLEVQEKMRLQNGAQFRLVSASNGQLIVAPIEPQESPEWKWEPNDRWQSLQGILSDHPEHDTTAAKKAEREWELAHDERKFGPFPIRNTDAGVGLLAGDGVAEE